VHATFCRMPGCLAAPIFPGHLRCPLFHTVSFATPCFYRPPPASTRQWVALSSALVVHFVAASALLTISPQSLPVHAAFPIEVRLLGAEPASPRRLQSDITPALVHDAQAAASAPIPQPAAQDPPSVLPPVIAMSSAPVASPSVAVSAGALPVALSESGQEAGHRVSERGSEPTGGLEATRPKSLSPPSEPLVEARFDAAYLTNPKPAYPAASRRMGESGVVYLRVEVDAEGQALQVQVKSSSGYPRLDRAAQETVSGWRFIPARRGKLAVASWVVVPINYSLN
jgi:protein TonB